MTNPAPPEKPECCECCQFETPELELYTQTFPEWKHWYCIVCAGSMISGSHHYQFERNSKDVLQAMAYCTNLILAEIRKGR